MIAANELRIGNWVELVIPRHNEKIIQVESLSEECINIFFRQYDLVEIAPIPLTPEILEKCEGVKKEDYQMSGCNVYDIDNAWRIAHKYRDGENEFYLWHKQVSPPTWSLLQVSHLHTFQNLYFALTGEELNYTP